MTEEIKMFLGRLRTVRAKAKEEDLSTMRIYQKVSEGFYETVDICGIRFIVNGE